MPQLVPIAAVVLADDVIDGTDLGDVVGGADHEVLHQALLQKPAGGALGDTAQHGTELADGQQVGVGFKFAFILESGHGLPPVCGLSMADGTHVPDGPGRPILGPWPPFGLRFPMIFPTLLKKHFVRRNGLFSFFQPKCPCFSALFQLPQVLLTGVRANQLRFAKQDSKSVGLIIRVGSSPTTGTIEGL